jgi:hypothetical protein
MRPGSESHDQHARLRVAKTWHGTAPVLLATVGPALNSPDLFAMRNQARAAKAVDYFVVQYLQTFQISE